MDMGDARKDVISSIDAEEDEDHEYCSIWNCDLTSMDWLNDEEGKGRDTCAGAGDTLDEEETLPVLRDTDWKETSVDFLLRVRDASELNLVMLLYLKYSV